MNLAKLSSNGQITVPVEIRRALGLKSGDKILFFEKPDGEVVITNASTNAIRKAQRAFEERPTAWASKTRTMCRH